MATTTNYGFEIPDDTDLVKDGALAMRDLGQDVDTQLFTALGGAYPGLRLVKKQTIGSAVSSVQVTSAFSATYENYRIIVTGGAATGTAGLRLTLGATATGYYGKTIFGLYSNDTVSGFGVSNGTSWQNAGQATTAGLSLTCDLQNPFTSIRTVVNSNNSGIATNEAFYSVGGFLNDTTSYTSFTLTLASGTMTGGTIYVYGYGAS